MAVMATEQPQSIALDPKVSSLAAEKDQMVIDEPLQEAVNGTTENASFVNGKSHSPEPTRNQEAFAANGAIPSPVASKPTIADSEMEVASEPKDQDEVVAPVEAAQQAQAPASPPRSSSPRPPKVDESMDVDVSTDKPDVSSSAEHIEESTQETSALDESMVVTSPQDLSQSADVSKLDIKSPPIEPQDDVPMSDRAASPAKASREREEDPADEPSAKRAKLELEVEPTPGTPVEKAGDSIGVASGLSPAPAESLENVADDIPDDLAINAFQSKEIRKELARVKKTKNGMNFRASVEKLWPAIWENYKQMIDNPVDLSLFEAKFRDNKYTTFGEFKADLQLLYDNSLKFNGTSNVVTVAATRVRNDLFTKLSEIYKLQEPARTEKGKTQPTRHTEPRAAAQPRRQSTSQPQPRIAASSPKPKSEVAAPASATPTPVSTSAPAFALPPNGVPQIRRDSTRDDGDRPKRPIHPPKNRDPDYTAQNSRKKKMDPEIKFYAEVLAEVKKQKYWSQNQWFQDPVDPVALNIPQYFNIIKKPMDLRTMTQKMDDGDYRSGKEVEKDMKQIVANSELFNTAESSVTKAAQELENLFKEKLKDKAVWMARNFPPAPSVTASNPSPDVSDQESDEESDEDVGVDSESLRNVTARLTEEQEKLNTMLFGSKAPDKTMVEIQQNVVNMLQLKLVEEKSKAGSSKKSKPQKKSTKAKAKSGAAAGGSSKKGTNAASSSKSRPSTSKKPQGKKRHIGPLEKTVVTEGIGELDGPTLDKAVDIIKKDTNQKEDDDGQLELDIEVLSQDALAKLFELINRAYPNIYENVSKRPEYSNQAKQNNESQPRASNASKPRKNKPMNKHEQERNIEKLRELKARFQRQGSGSQEPILEDEEQRMGNSSEEESDSEEE